MKTDTNILLLAAALLLTLTACMESVEPAGPAQYENPEYPSELYGYAICSAQFSDVFLYQDRVCVLDRVSSSLVSFSVNDPKLQDPDSLVDRDTLPLGFAPGKSCLLEDQGVLFVSHSTTNDLYRIDDLAQGSPVLLSQCESILTDVFPADQGSSLLLCFLGPEWLVRKIDSTTGSVLGEYSTDWPITRAALSPSGERLLLSNSGREYLIEIDTGSMERTDSIPMPERVGPFLYNTSGDLVVFNQYSIKPKVYLLDRDTREILITLDCINPYRVCDLMPGTDVLLAPRRSDNRISVLNSQNMIFAPSILCYGYPEMAFASPDGQYIFAVTDTPGRVTVYSHQ